MEILPPVSTSNDKLWIILCHLSIFLGMPFLLPFIIYLVKKNDSILIRNHSAEVLNFHLSLLIYAAVSGVLCLVLVGFVLLGLIGLLSLICAILAALQASEGKFFRYPVTIRFVS